MSAAGGNRCELQAQTKGRYVLLPFFRVRPGLYHDERPPRRVRYLRKVKKLDGFQVLLQSYDREYDAETVQLNECTFLGRAVKLEITL